MLGTRNVKTKLLFWDTRLLCFKVIFMIPGLEKIIDEYVMSLEASKSEVKCI